MLYMLSIERAAAHIIVGQGAPQVVIKTREGDPFRGPGVELERHPLPVTYGDAGTVAADLEAVTGWEAEDPNGTHTYVEPGYVTVNVVRVIDPVLKGIRESTDAVREAEERRVLRIRAAFDAGYQRGSIAAAARMTRDGVYKLMKANPAQ